MIVKKLKEYQERYKKALARQDGRCTMFFNGWWKDCCVEHDYGCADAAARQSESERLEEDEKLRDCVNKKSPKLKIGDLMFWGIRELYLKPRKKLFGTPMY